MAGHSKRFKVKHAKGSLDQKRGRLLSKPAKEIIVVAHMGGGDPRDADEVFAKIFA